MKRFLVPSALFLSPLSSFLLVLVILGCVARPFRIEGKSMEPTLSPGDFLVIGLHSSVRRGDIVVIQGPKGFLMVKRVAGVPGDLLTMKGSQLQIQEEVIPLKQSPFPWAGKRLGPGEMFLLGDNTDQSWDSRSFGPINIHQVVGRCWGHFRFQSSQ